jgi:hypothetical protein
LTPHVVQRRSKLRDVHVGVVERGCATVGEQLVECRDGRRVRTIGALERRGDVDQLGTHFRDPVVQQQLPTAAQRIASRHPAGGPA